MSKKRGISDENNEDPDKRNDVSTHHMITRRMVMRDLSEELKTLENSYEKDIKKRTPFRADMVTLHRESIEWNTEVMEKLTRELFPLTQAGTYSDTSFNPEFYFSAISERTGSSVLCPRREPIYKLSEHNSSTLVGCMAITVHQIFQASLSNIAMIKSDPEDSEEIYKHIYQYRQEPSYEDDYEMIIYDALSGIFFPNPRLNYDLASYVTKTSRKNNERDMLICDIYSFTIKNAGLFIREVLDLKENSVAVLTNGDIVQHGSPVDRIDTACNKYIKYGVPLYSGISCKLLNNGSIAEFLAGKVISFPVRSFTLDYRVAEHFAYTRPGGTINGIEFDKVIFVYLCKDNIPYVSPDSSWECEAIFASSNFIYLSHSIINKRLLIYINLIPIEFELSVQLVDAFLEGKKRVANEMDTDAEDSDTDGGRRTRRLRKSRKKRSVSRRGENYKKSYKKRRHRKTIRNPFAFMRS